MERMTQLNQQIDRLSSFLGSQGMSEPKRDAIEADLYALWEEREAIEDRNYCVVCCMHHIAEEGCTHHSIDGAIG